MDHVRIDEGVKRAERKPVQPMAHRPSNGQFLPKLPEDFDANGVLQRIANGERASDIAREMGVHPSALYHRFASDARYVQARKHGSAVRLDCAEREIETADSPLTLARAREVHRAVAWRASVEHPEAWGPKQEITHTHTIPDDVRQEIGRLREELGLQTIDVTPAPVPQLTQVVDAND